MVKIIISYVDEHVICEMQKGVRVFNSVDDAVKFVQSELVASVPVATTDK